MKKQRLPLILLLVLVIIMIVGLVACNPTAGRKPSGTMIIDDPVSSDPVDIEDSSKIGSKAAWDMLKAAALRASAEGKDARYLDFDTSIDIGYAKDSYSAYYVLRIAGHVDTQSNSSNASDSQVLIELNRVSKTVLPDGTEDVIGEGTVMSLYYLDKQIIIDLSGIKKGAHVVQTKDIDLAALLGKLNGIVEQLGISELLWNKVFGMNVGSLLKDLAGIDALNLTVEDVISRFIFGANISRIIDYGEGHQVLQIPCDLSLIVSILPLVQGLIPENIIDLIDSITRKDNGISMLGIDTVYRTLNHPLARTCHRCHMSITELYDTIAIKGFWQICGGKLNMANLKLLETK